VPLELKVWNLNYGNEIILYEIRQFPNRVPNHMVIILLPKEIQLEENMFMPPCGFANKVQPMCKHYKMPNAYDCEALVNCDLGGRLITNGRIWMLGSRLMVVIIIWGLNCLIKNVNVIVIIIVAPILCF